MKVLHVLRSDGFAGVERHIAVLAAAQESLGHDVTVIGGDQAKMRSALGNARVQLAPGNTVGEVIVQARRHGDVDLVHAHMTAAEFAASISTRKPIVVTRHFARTRGASAAGRLAGRLVRQRANAQIAISKYVAQAVDGPAAVVYPGVEQVDSPIASRSPDVLVVQRLQPEKNTDIALRAFAAGAPPGWRLKIAGDGAELAELKSLASRLGIADRTQFIGFHDHVPTLMQSASILVAPCQVEGLGLSVLEAMSHALPVIASRAGAHPETVGRAVDAQLFNPGDATDAGRMLANLCSDEALRVRYGHQLRYEQRAHFTPRAQAQATEVIYRGVLE